MLFISKDGAARYSFCPIFTLPILLPTCGQGGPNMLFMLKSHIAKPETLSNKEFYSIWRQESEAALAAVKAGAIKGIWKVAGQPEIITIIDVPGADDLDHAMQQFPMWKLGFSHIVADFQIIPLRPYENWAEDLKELSKG